MKMQIIPQSYGLEPYEINMELVAADLAILLHHSGLSRADVAQKLGWKKSRVTRVLSGDQNLTIKTISEFVEALGYTFDVVFYNKSYPKPKQPWQMDKMVKKIAKSEITIQLQTGDCVFRELLDGNDGDYYIRIDNKEFLNAKCEIQNIELSQNLLTQTVIQTFSESLFKEVSYEYA